jgi:hypothetical protein
VYVYYANKLSQEGLPRVRNLGAELERMRGYYQRHQLARNPGPAPIAGVEGKFCVIPSHSLRRYI